MVWLIVTTRLFSHVLVNKSNVHNKYRPGDCQHCINFPEVTNLVNVNPLPRPRFTSYSAFQDIVEERIRVTLLTAAVGSCD